MILLSMTVMSKTIKISLCCAELAFNIFYTRTTTMCVHFSCVEIEIEIILFESGFKNHVLFSFREIVDHLESKEKGYNEFVLLCG